MFGNDGRIVTGLYDWAGAKYYFDPRSFLAVRNSAENVGYGWAYFDNNGQMSNITLNHTWYSQLNQGMPEGCEGASLQIVASTAGRHYDLNDIYSHIGYDWGYTPYNGFYGNPYGGAADRTQTVFASTMARNFSSYVPGIRDLTGADTQKVIDELRNGHSIVTWVNYVWNVNSPLNFHVMAIVGYQNGQFLISDPYATSQREYWVSSATWADVNSHSQAIGWNTPASMNLVIN